MSNEESDRKLGELILYISQKCAHDSDFGATKLNKILYFSDFFAYGNWGKSITGADYQHLQYGPAPRRLKPLRKQLQDNGDLAVQPVPMAGVVQHRTINLREPVLGLFTGEEIALVDRVIEQLAGFNAVQASELSHQFVGWKFTQVGETIPYESIFWSDSALSESELKLADDIVLEQELQVA
jgi:hypothetical protein